ncbi:hypothetical protein [Streptomyces sp. CO7]
MAKSSPHYQPVLARTEDGKEWKPKTQRKVRPRADQTYLDLGDGFTCTVSEAQSMLRMMIKHLKRTNRAEVAGTLRAAQRRLIAGDLELDRATRNALRKGVAVGRRREHRDAQRRR